MPERVGSSEGLGLSSRGVEFVKDIGALLLVALAIRELDGAETVALIEPARSGIGLEGVQANRQGQGAQGVGQEKGANAVANECRIDGHLCEPGDPIGVFRVHSRDDGAFALCDDDATRREQLARDPLAEFFVGVN